MVEIGEKVGGHADGFGHMPAEERDDGGKDVFVHVNSLAPGVASLSENQTVEFDVEEGQKGPQAVNVKPV